MKFRKKPVVIEARQLTQESQWGIAEWIGRSCTWQSSGPVCGLKIQTLEGSMMAIGMDWIVKGVAGEFYPCKPDIFDATYDPVDEPIPSTVPTHPAPTRGEASVSESERPDEDARTMALWKGKPVNSENVCRELKRVEEENAVLQTRLDRYREALEFYADPSTYHAIAFLFDRPCGGFAEDFSKDHGEPFYDRPMPGQTAREALGGQE